MLLLVLNFLPQFSGKNICIQKDRDKIFTFKSLININLKFNLNFILCIYDVYYNFIIFLYNWFKFRLFLKKFEKVYIKFLERYIFILRLLRSTRICNEKITKFNLEKKKLDWIRKQIAMSPATHQDIVVVSSQRQLFLIKTSTRKYETHNWIQFLTKLFAAE